MENLPSVFKLGHCYSHAIELSLRVELTPSTILVFRSLDSEWNLHSQLFEASGIGLEIHYRLSWVSTHSKH